MIATEVDIVERLREYHRDMVEMDNGECGATAMYREAADEIERLRGLLYLASLEAAG